MGHCCWSGEQRAAAPLQGPHCESPHMLLAVVCARLGKTCRQAMQSVSIRDGRLPVQRCIRRWLWEHASLS